MLLHPPIDHLSPLHPRQQTLAAILREGPSSANRRPSRCSNVGGQNCGYSMTSSAAQQT